tara:strand:- start:1055 stop:1849 length:795 start_codon:yes stop_codon:yes gene_type:complete
MRITYRRDNNKNYWTKRWENIPVDSPMDNLSVYPLRYANMTIQDDKSGRIMEAGCGNGRILRYFHDKGYDIVGMDFIKVAIQKLKESDPSLKVEVGDITNLEYADKSFKYILAFGLFHNLEKGLELSIKETFRILASGGRVCASFRADNIQTRLTDWLAERRSKNLLNNSDESSFHKMNLTKKEFINLFKNAGFLIDSVSSVENMPILYKFKFFRAYSHKNFNENKARAEGYQLSWLGKIFQKSLMLILPNQFCNIYVLIAERP